MSLWNPDFRLVLASGSATRRALLAAAGLPFETAAPEVDERALEAATDRSPATVARALARAKALDVSARRPSALERSAIEWNRTPERRPPGRRHAAQVGLEADPPIAAKPQKQRALVLGADQVLSLDGRLFHKSTDRVEALATLAGLAGRTHRLTSAFALARDGEVVAEDSDFAELAMRPLDEASLNRYLDLTGEAVLGSVGVYHWEGLGAHLFERIEGDHTTILGLPMLKLLAALRALGALTL